MKKFFALLMAVVTLMSMSAFSLAEDAEAGFDEYELGVEGEQEVGFMTMAMVYFQPVDMAPPRTPPPRKAPTCTSKWI